ncbi:hypothetical protein RHMOL_Rhmol02G0201800 [Rhododendron molle]|uniref:Uncharacterized protein n=1 Tax=Rhododendron molle TaxID=49168 RepID=A0ACC0PSJ6_RHOML|nr:hypothetical protein RHMOL_Rhmol02G0201800 [Rhododendron molle]
MLSKFDLPAGSELRAFPQPPPKELGLPEEEDEVVPNPEARVTPEDHANPDIVTPIDTYGGSSLLSFLKHLYFRFMI